MSHNRKADANKHQLFLFPAVSSFQQVLFLSAMKVIF